MTLRELSVSLKPEEWDLPLYINESEVSGFKILDYKEGELSNCCNAPKWLNLEFNICSACKGLAEFSEELPKHVCLKI